MNVIYTAIFGDYDDLKEPLVVTPGWFYICYTDQPFKSDTWKIIQANPNDVGGNVRASRLLKIDFPIWNKSIWVDGSFTINCDLNKFWEDNFVSPFTVVQHPIRNCWFEETLACINNNRGKAEDIMRQQELYLNEGLPMDAGLIQSGILLRENTQEVKEFCDLWWEQIKLSTRDQIGFAYAEWKLNKKWPRIQMDYRTSTDFIFKTHKHRRHGNTHKSIK